VSEKKIKTTNYAMNYGMRWTNTDNSGTCCTLFILDGSLLVVGPFGGKYQTSMIGVIRGFLVLSVVDVNANIKLDVSLVWQNQQQGTKSFVRTIIV
jgi:hypothetical protein